MASITYDGNTPGRAGSRQLWAGGGRPMKVVTGSFNFDSSYPTGGESISDLFDQFQAISSTSGLLGVMFEDTALHSFALDRTAGSEKILAYVKTTGAQVGNGVDISASVPRFFAWGYIK